MTDEHRVLREQLGAYVLGHLSDEEVPGVRAHLDGCASCRAEVEELRAVVEVLPTADPERESRAAAPPELAERVFARIARARAEAGLRRRRRLVSVLAAAAATAAVALAAVSLFPSASAGRQVAFAELPAGVDAGAYLLSRPWGTEIELEVAGLSGDGAGYAVWLEDSGGERTPAGTFVAVPDRELRVVLASALPMEDAVALGVSDPEGRTVMLAPIALGSSGPS